MILVVSEAVILEAEVQVQIFKINIMAKIMASQETVINLLKTNQLTHFKKSGEFSFEVSDKLQEIVTEINGEVETTNYAQKGDYILTGASGEKYILSPSTFTKRYEVLSLDQVTIPRDILPGDVIPSKGTAKATGECWGFEFKGEPFRFNAPWNEEMIINKGDYLVSPNPELTQAYRIERSTFDKTYSKV
jgi:hypothetical protein